MIDHDVREDILLRIKKAEEEHNIKVLYAIESGSRAWGFASPNSDYDVRFIYIHPTDYYLTIDLEEQRDVIDYEIIDEIDINGWDIRKALKLLLKSNPSLIEWLHSPIVYVKDNEFFSEMHQILKKIYSLKSVIYHYRSMALGNYLKYLQKEQILLKKYFYVLRPLLAVQWVEKYAEIPPIKFDKLCTLLPEDGEIITEINSLLAQKKISNEECFIEPSKILHKFIEDELKRLKNTDKIFEKVTKYEVNLANDFFRKLLNGK